MSGESVPQAAGATKSGVSNAPRATWRGGLLALAFVVAGPLVQTAAIDVHWINRTVLFLWLGALAGGVLALRTLLRRPGILGGVLSGVALLLSAGLLAIVNFGLSLPKSGADKLTVAPEFALVDHTGRETTLAELRGGRGAVLVFYRGFW